MHLLCLAIIIKIKISSLVGERPLSIHLCLSGTRRSLVSENEQAEQDDLQIYVDK